MKPILIVRPPNTYQPTNKDAELISKIFENKIIDEYICYVIFNENETNKTTFELIK